MKIIGILEEKDDRKALYAALIFMMLMLLFFLLVGMTEPDPPLQEKIVEVEIEFGSPPMGGGSSSSQESNVTNTVTESAQEIDTQEESSVYVPSGQGSSSTSQNTEEEQPDLIDHSFDNAFGNGNGQGNGDGDAFGNGDGLGGTGDGQTPGPGPSTNLKRKIVDRGGITAQSQEEGKVAIDIWVNDKGEVVKTKFNPIKSNSPSSYLIGLATKWAKTMQYEKSLGSPTQFVGYQVFNFTKQ